MQISIRFLYTKQVSLIHFCILSDMVWSRLLGIDRMGDRQTDRRTDGWIWEHKHDVHNFIRTSVNKSSTIDLAFVLFEIWHDPDSFRWTEWQTLRQTYGWIYSNDVYNFHLISYLYTKYYQPNSTHAGI
jgi:hypothetical protein